MAPLQDFNSPRKDNNVLHGEEVSCFRTNQKKNLNKLRTSHPVGRAADNVLRIDLVMDYQIRFPIPDPRNRRVEVVDRSRLLLSILKNITQEYTRDKYMRRAISSLANVDVHVVLLYRCLQSIYDSFYDTYGMSLLTF